MIYAVEAVGLGLVKIGFSKNDSTLTKRLGTLRAGPAALRVLGVFRKGTRETEKALHRKLAWHHVRNEWFLLKGVRRLIKALFKPWRRKAGRTK